MKIPKILLLGAAALFLASPAYADVMVNDNGVVITDHNPPAAMEERVVHRGAGREVFHRHGCLVEREWAGDSYSEHMQCHGHGAHQEIHTHQNVVIDQSPP